MRNLIGRLLPTLLTGAVGMITFLAFILPGLDGWRTGFVRIAVVIAGWAVILGFWRLITAHARRIYRGQAIVYSLSLIIVAVLTAVFRLLDGFSGDQSVSDLLFNSVLAPLQAALGALLAVFLALAAVRMLHLRRRWATVWFLTSAIIVLLTQGTPDQMPPFFYAIRRLIDAATTGGLRGLLIGVALGTLATAIRVLLLLDRPQSE